MIINQKMINHFEKQGLVATSAYLRALSVKGKKTVGHKLLMDCIKYELKIQNY